MLAEDHPLQIQSSTWLPCFFFSFLIISPCIDKLKYHLWKMCLSIKWVKVQCVKPVPEVEIRALLHWVDCSKN